MTYQRKTRASYCCRNGRSILASYANSLGDARRIVRRVRSLHNLSLVVLETGTSIVRGLRAVGEGYRGDITLG